MDLNWIFSEVLNRNLTASVVILIVVCARFLLRGAPKLYSYLLWALVMLRLLCPLSVSSPFSVLPEPVTSGEIVSRLAEAPVVETQPRPDSPSTGTPVEQEVSPAAAPAVVSTPDSGKSSILPWIWLAGMGSLLLYSVLSYIKIRRKVRIAVPFRRNVYIADDVSTPFVMGFFPPKIYLPGTLTASERKLILCHERHHIRRGDHIFKALGFLALSIHWFNPLVWLAFTLACRDMEMSCDEAVIGKLGQQVRADYSAALLNVAAGHRFVPGTPLAFGEGNPKGRIRNLANWKKPAFWVILLCVILCSALAVGLLTDPEKTRTGGISGMAGFFRPGEQMSIGSDIDGNTDGVIAVGLEEDPGFVGLEKSYESMEFLVEVQYREREKDAWTSLGSETFTALGEVHTFRVPTGCDYQVTATLTQGNGISVKFAVANRGVFLLSDVEKRNVNQITLRNLQNETDTRIIDPTAISQICTYLDSICGVDYGGSGKDQENGAYEVILSSGDTPEIFRLVFGPDNSFYSGEGADGYPIDYQMLGTDIRPIVSYLSAYDSSGFDWTALWQAEDAMAQVPTTDFGVSIQPERVSRTGAIATFVYSGSVPGEEGAELSYGDFLSLDRLENGVWVSVPELPGYEYTVGDASYPVTDGYGMVHEWDNRFGALPDGVYRIGKPVTLHRPDGSTQLQMIYGEFSIPDSILTGPLPLEDLPERYGGEEAMIDGCLVLSDGYALHNKEQFQLFAERCAAGEAGFFRIVNGHNGDPAQRSVHDLTFDGETYTLEWLADGRRQSKTYRYLMHYTGEKERADQEYDAYEHYVLVNDNTVSWQNIWAQSANVIDHWTVYSNYIYYPKSPEIPEDPVQAVLTYKGDSLVLVTDPERLKSIHDLFANGDLMGYEPKTHSVGVGLDLIITGKSGKTLTIELDPDQDICRIQGEYVFYGAFDEPDYVLKLWAYLGIQQWPEIVYQECENAFRP